MTQRDVGVQRRVGPLARSQVERLLSFVLPGENGCWEWQGSRKNRRYGEISFRNRRIVAHRASYELFIGPIPEGLCLDHLCRNTFCVNPTHVEPVTNRENILRGTAPPAANAAKMVCKRGHSLGADGDVHINKRGERICRACQRLLRMVRRAA